ncbi:hypothetical protein ACFVH0_10510 [Streptomyces sp. NPDC127117]
MRRHRNRVRVLLAAATATSVAATFLVLAELSQKHPVSPRCAEPRARC